MILFNMKFQKMRRGKIPPALNTAVDMRLEIMDLVVFVRGEGERVPVGRE